ncbi:hypothetical protein [Pontiella agarivorans]|uniref:Uncharacterized protein n=1 Tax=Pontiella agarivorans TaxID=3038953 RepID=A0ABU5MX06_9BACT|nr:hypothetical protein [Pontiella agarivorans]MDZ8118678.1 hypothetical protein [Pontiella agarivorans]
MNGLKHILVVIALLFSALPCIHAEDQACQPHEKDASQQLFPFHVCGCHHCDELACSEELDAETSTVSVTVAVEPLPQAVILYVFTETKPVLRRATSPVYSALTALKIVHLLI